jgi:Flp pilus assembly protein TadG
LPWIGIATPGSQPQFFHPANGALTTPHKICAHLSECRQGPFTIEAFEKLRTMSVIDPKSLLPPSDSPHPDIPALQYRPLTRHPGSTISWCVMMNAWKKFCRTLSAFRVAKAGNVAITFAFASLPIIGFVGAAIDYSRANSVKAAMQTALDATALMLAKEAATDTEDQLKENAKKYFKALFTREEAKDIDVQVVYSTTGGSHVDIKATAALEAQFIRVLGYDTFHVGASSTAKWGLTRLRVALVLDNTGSMDSAGKMTALKTATKSLIDQLTALSPRPATSMSRSFRLRKTSTSATRTLPQIGFIGAPHRETIILTIPGLRSRMKTLSITHPGMRQEEPAAAEVGARGAPVAPMSAPAVFRDTRTRIPARVPEYAVTGATARKATA